MENKNATNYRPLKNQELINQGQKNSLAELAAARNANFKAEKENFQQLEQRREVNRVPQKTFVQRSVPQTQVNLPKNINKNR